MTEVTEHPTLAAALVAALTDLTVVDKGRTAKVKTKTGNDYSYDYADLGDVVKLTRPALAAHGLVALTPVEEHEHGLKVTVVLLHSSGERLDFGPFPFQPGSDAQSTGSAVTYYRRYALTSALGIAAGDDDDGATAKPAQPEARRQQPSEPLAAKEEHEVIRNIIDGLVPSQKTALQAWWAEQGLPGIKGADRLTVAQAELVLAHLDEVDVPGGDDGEGSADAPVSAPHSDAVEPSPPDSVGLLGGAFPGAENAETGEPLPTGGPTGPAAVRAANPALGGRGKK